MSGRSSAPPLVEVRATAHEVAVLIRGLPHLLLRRADVVALQSYVKSEGPARPMYFLEITTASGVTISSDYDTREVWVAVLEGLRDCRLFDERFGERQA